MTAVRKATEKDISRILELYRQLTITTSPTEQNHTSNLDDYRQAFIQIQKATGYNLLVAEEQGNVIGTMVLIIVPNLSHSALPWATIENVVVDEEYRRRGIGRLLMDYATARAKEAGCYKIQLISDKRRTESHKFYRNLGYKASGHGFRLYL
jgi:L-amino acid N-acyltransferase YncA